jgi:hypothetical protein
MVLTRSVSKEKIAPNMNVPKTSIAVSTTSATTSESIATTSHQSGSTESSLISLHRELELQNELLCNPLPTTLSYVPLFNPPPTTLPRPTGAVPRRLFDDEPLSLTLPLHNIANQLSSTLPLPNVVNSVPPIAIQTEEAELMERIAQQRRIIALKRELADLEAKNLPITIARQTPTPPIVNMENIIQGVTKIRLDEVRPLIASFPGNSSYPVKKWISDYENVMTSFNALSIRASSIETNHRKKYIKL